MNCANRLQMICLSRASLQPFSAFTDFGLLCGTPHLYREVCRHSCSTMCAAGSALSPSMTMTSSSGLCISAKLLQSMLTFVMAWMNYGKAHKKSWQTCQQAAYKQRRSCTVLSGLTYSTRPKLDGFGNKSMKGNSVVLRASSMPISAAFSKLLKRKK